MALQIPQMALKIPQKITTNGIKKIQTKTN
jgi:hypothetical protein